jgi:hypothetical protein
VNGTKKSRRIKAQRLSRYVAHSCHHRLPRSLGGSKKFPHDNCVTIPDLRHTAWHKVARNFWVEAILYLSNTRYLHNGSIFVPVRVDGGKLADPAKTDKRIQRYKEPSVDMLEAWEFLFGGMDADEIAANMHRDFLDPRYRVEVHSRNTVVSVV